MHSGTTRPHKKESATMTTPAVRKSSQVSTTVSPELFDALEDHRWTARKKMTEVIAEAVSDYVAKHKIVVKSDAAQDDSKA